nr:MAG TPA: hypothetical protein [Bacteriophage sp.]
MHQSLNNLLGKHLRNIWQVWLATEWLGLRVLVKTDIKGC